MIQTQIANRIKEIRLSKKMTLQQVADKMGTSRMNISKIESGRQSPNVSTLEKIARALDCTVEVIITPNATTL